jgi:hypothetical protein
MPIYEARFLTHGDDLFSKVRFHAAHDEAAIRYTNVALRTSIGKGHEIWHGDRLGQREIYERYLEEPKVSSARPDSFGAAREISLGAAPVV